MNKLLSKEEIFKGPRFNVIRKKYKRDDGIEYLRDCVEPGNAVVIIPVMENGDVIFIKQYREVADKVLLEFPAGIIDKNEEPIEAAKRELEEETRINY